MGEVVTVQVRDPQFAEDVVEDRGRHLDRVVAFDRTRRLEPGEGERLHELLQRHAVLKADRDGDGEVVHQAAEGGALLVHVDEDLAEAAVLVLAAPEVDLVAADPGFLGVALAPARQAVTLQPGHHPLDDPLGDELGARRRRPFGEFVGEGVHVLDVEQRGGQRLRQLRSVAVERRRLQSQTPSQHVGLIAVADRCRAGHVDGLRDGAADERLGRRHHPDVAFHRQMAGPGSAAGVGAVEHREVLGREERRALQGHRPADVVVGGVDLLAREPDRREQAERHVVQRFARDAQLPGAEILAERPFVEGEADVEGFGDVLLHRLDGGVGEALVAERPGVDARRAVQGSVAHRVADDLLDLLFGVTQPGERQRHRAVDDLEIAAAGQGLELDQGEVGLDAGGVAVHHQADGAGGGDHRRLGVAVAVGLAEGERPVPGGARGGGQRPVGDGGDVERDGRHRQLLVAHGIAVGGAPVVADHPQHRLAVLGEAGEGAQLAGDLGRCGVGDRGHQRADRAAGVARVVGVVGGAGGHQVAADVGEAEAQGAELVGQLGDPPRRELGHHHRDLEHQGPQPDPMLERRNVDLAVGVLERHQVERRQVAGGIVEEHVLGAGIRRVDAAAGRAGVPIVDGGVVLEAGVGAAPGGVGNLIPQLAGADALGDAAVGPADQLPFAFLQHLVEERVGHPDAVVGVLPGDGAVGL